MSKENIGEEESKYWVYPIALAELWEEGEINEAEFMLLGKLHTFKSCFASNAWIAKWWKRTPHYVSQSLSKLAKAGLIKVEDVDGRRQIRTCFETCRKIDRVSKNRQGVCGKIDRPSYVVDSYSHEGRLRDPSGTSGFFKENGTSPSEDAKRLTRLFYEGLIKYNAHQRKPDLPGGDSDQAKKKRKSTFVKWMWACEDLIERKGLSQVESAIEWYFHHFKDPYVAVLTAMTTFSEVNNFEKIIKAMGRAKHANPDDENYTVITRRRTNAPAPDEGKEDWG